MSGSIVEKNLLAENELLKLALSEKQVENQHILNRNVELEEKLLAWQEKFQRLYESHKRTQTVNQNLEEKLLRLVDENTRQRAKLTNSCASLNIRLNKSNARVIHLQNEIERYKKDISLAINLLRLNPDSFVSPNFKSLPSDTQSKLCQFVKKSSDVELHDADYSASFHRGYQSVPVSDPVFHCNDLMSPVTVSKFLESELRKNVGIQTNSANLPYLQIGENLKDISHDENFVHHEKCDRVKSNAQASMKSDVPEKLPEQHNVSATGTKSKKISLQQLKESEIKQFQHFLSFVKNKSLKNPRICAVRINDEGIYLDLDSSQELLIKTSFDSDDPENEKIECKSTPPASQITATTTATVAATAVATPTTTIDETYSINKTDSEKFNEIKCITQLENSPRSNENAYLKHQRVAEWLKSNLNAIPIPLDEKSAHSIHTKESDDVLQMEYNVKRFMLKNNEWKEEINSDDFCKSINEINPSFKLHRTETNL